MDDELNSQGAEDEVEGNEVDEASAPAKEAKSPKRFTPEEIKEIRAMRAIPHDENPARPKYGHAAIAEKFGRNGQQISSIVRNLSHPDPEYTPVFDGFRNRPRDEEGKVIKTVKPAPEVNAETGEPVVAKKRGRKKAVDQTETQSENAEA